MKTKEMRDFLVRKEASKYLKKSKILKEIEKYADQHYNQLPMKVSKKRVFYHYTEWSGWRFYKKAIMSGDFRSIIQHIKDRLNT